MSGREPLISNEVRDHSRSVLSVDEARARILSFFNPLSPVDKPLLESLGLVLARDVIAEVDLPAFRNSAMDGYAVRSVDTERSSATAPISLTVVGDVPAGQVAREELLPGTAMRIMTGAPLPNGADAVIRFEDVERSQNQSNRTANHEYRSEIVISKPVDVSQNVRQPGEDVLSGSIVLNRGTVIEPPQVGVLAALNQAVVRVIPRPRVAILATGNEVVDLGPELSLGQIRNSNSYLIAALTRSFGAESQVIGIAEDTEHDIIDKLVAAKSANLIVTTGGVSVGDFDAVKRVLRQKGTVDLWQVRMKPGRPLAFGKFERTPLLGLPGNPVAAAVAYTQFGGPAIRLMLGCSNVMPRTLRARTTHEIRNSGGRRHFLRGIAKRDGESLTVQVLSNQGSGVLSSLAHANCYVVIDEDAIHVDAGSWVTIEPFDVSFKG